MCGSLDSWVGTEEEKLMRSALQKEKEDLEDISNELELADDEDMIPYALPHFPSFELGLYLPPFIFPLRRRTGLTCAIAIKSAIPLSPSPCPRCRSYSPPTRRESKRRSRY